MDILNFKSDLHQIRRYLSECTEKNDIEGMKKWIQAMYSLVMGFAYGIDDLKDIDKKNV